MFEITKYSFLIIFSCSVAFVVCSRTLSSSFQLLSAQVLFGVGECSCWEFTESELLLHSAVHLKNLGALLGSRVS